MPAPFPFDAVLFDLDGTLVATDRFWPDAARLGAKRAFAELGVERPLPSRGEWMGMVGLAIEVGFENVFPDLSSADRTVVMEHCLEEEANALRAGQAAMLPGVHATLVELRARGVRVGIASNCSQSYLDAMLDGLGLAEWVEEGRCLHTPGIANKADMVADLLVTFGTRSAVMVGDRAGDRDAGWRNGLPHVHLARGYASAGEETAAEAVILGMDELIPRLERRAEWIRAALDGLALGPGPRVIGVTGRPAAGKSLFARDAARVLRASGGEATVVALEEFAALESAAPADLLRSYDVAALRGEVIEPHARGESGARGVLIVEGPFLLHPALRPHLDRVIHLEVSEELCLRRIAGRALLTGSEALVAARAGLLDVQRAFETEFPAVERADLFLAAENSLGPGPEP